SMDSMYKLFREVVAEDRGMDFERVSRLAEGRVYTGRQAKQWGLVDELGELEDAVKWVGGEGYYKVINFPKMGWKDALGARVRGELGVVGGGGGLGGRVEGLGWLGEVWRELQGGGEGEGEGEGGRWKWFF
ncbi:hypothetical protein TrCOL_g4251, partial [Triparma columacea]